MEIEFGYSCDLALERLIDYFVYNEKFLKDTERFIEAFSKYGNVEYCSIILHDLDPKVQLFPKHKSMYEQFTSKWLSAWEKFKKVVPDEIKSEIIEVSEKWGLRCPWGCGFILDPSLHPSIQKGDEKYPRIMLSRMVKPLPQEFRRTITLGVETSDDKRRQRNIRYSIEAIDGKKEIKKTFGRFGEKQLEQIHEKLTKDGFRGFEKHKKKEISIQVDWLLWHMTPPYLNSSEIADRVQKEKGLTVDPFYIQRCYKNMANLLEIKLIKGWPKGRKRASQQTRAEFNPNKIEAKMM